MTRKTWPALAVLSLLLLPADRIIFAATRTGALNTGWKSIGSATVP
jgi:hypothetical protein